MSFSERADMLEVSRSDLAAIRMPWRGLLANKGWEWYTKISGRRIPGQGMIRGDPGQVKYGFASLSQSDFEAYNYPQVWVESRQIPRVLNKRISRRNAEILDLGCGRGDSTRLIGFFADDTWRISGFDITPQLIEQAQERSQNGFFRNKVGQVIRPQFFLQDLSQPLCRDGEIVPSESVDLCISCGVVGLYMSPCTAQLLISEVFRVTKMGGCAAIDTGPAVGVDTMRLLAKECGFKCGALVRSVPFDPRPKIILRK